MSLQISLLDLLEKSDQVTDWYMLGVYLKLPRDKLTEIERQFSGHGARRCKLEMFDLWMNLNPDASWELIVLALEKFGKAVLAEHVRERYLPSVAQSELDPTLTSEPKPVVTILLEKDKIRKFRNLEKEFAVITTDLKAVLEEKGLLTKLARFLTELLDEDEKLLQATSIDKLFLLIKPYYSFLSTGILEDIIDKFVGEPLKEQLKQYKKQLDKFAKTTKMSLLKKIQSQRPSSAASPPAVVLKLNGAWPSVTIKHFDKFVNQIFEASSFNLSHIHVKSGCICVSWFARRSAIPALVALAQQKVEFMRHVGVLRLSVGDTIILKQEKEEEEEEEEEEGNDLHSLLLRATTADCAHAVEFLLSIEADPNCTSENGDTPLIIACRNECISIANMLLTARANVNLQNKQGCTALIEVCRAEVPNKSLVRMLVQAGAEVNIPSGEIQVSFPDKDMVQVTALMLAAQGGHTNIVQYLLDEGADVNKLDAHGSSALMYASSRGHTKTVRLLLNYGADVNTQMTADGRTALMLASYGHIETVHLLLSHDATVNTQDEYGITALLIAACHGFPEIVHLLLNYGADVSIQDKGNNTVLHYACGRQRTECVDFLLATGADPNIQDAQGDTPLIFACRMKGDARDPAILIMLLSVSANPNIQTENGATALMFAAASSYQEGVEILLNAGASVNLQDSDGHTALHDAAREGNLEIVELLLASGAQASVSDKDGVTPLDLALDGGHDDMCQLLITSMESDPLTSQQLEHRQLTFQKSSNPVPPTTQDTHSSEHPQHHSAVQTTRTRLHHRRSLSTMHHYLENILLPDRAIKRREADNNSKQDSNTSKFNNYK